MPKKTYVEMIAELEAELKGCESPSGFREWQLQLASLAESYLPPLIARLLELEKKLPKCWRLNDAGKLVQDCPVVPDMDVWNILPFGKVQARVVAVQEQSLNVTWNDINEGREALWYTKDCFDSEAAACSVKGESRWLKISD